MSIVIGFNALCIFPWYVDADKQQGSDPSIDIKLMQSNLNTSNQQYDDFVNYVLQENPDIITLQEVSKPWRDKLSKLHNRYPFIKVIPRTDNFGIAVYSRIPFKAIHEVYFENNDIPSLHAELEINGRVFSLITTHLLPPMKLDWAIRRNQQLKDLAIYVKTINDSLILIGDLNVTMWSHIYHDFESATSLKNTRAGFGLLPTWPAGMGILKIPIDHCLISQEFQVKAMTAGQDIGSDHLPLIIDLELSQMN